MRLHPKAKTCPNSRRLLVSRIEEQGWSVMAAAEAAGISERSVYRWLAHALQLHPKTRSLGHKPPAARLSELTNVTGNYN
jgi:transposase